MKLNELEAVAGSVKKRMRVGRGIGSGKGKTAGSGHKGQKARSGVAINGYEGGQMPLYMRMPKRGFNAWRPNKYVEVTLDRLQEAVDAKKLDVKKDVTAEALKEAGVISKIKDGVRVIGNAPIKAKLSLKVTGATKGAKAAIEKAGGSIEILVKDVKKFGKAAEAEKAEKAKA